MTSRTLASTSIFLAPATAIFMAGYGFSFSQNVVPQLYDERPHHATPIFRRIFKDGAVTAIGGSVISSICSAYLAYLCTSGPQRRLYTFAAVATILTMPYTRLIMFPGIKRLISISESRIEQDKSEKTLEYRQLLMMWVLHNYVRCALYTAGGAAGLWAAIFG